MTTFVIHEKGSPMKKKTLIMLLTSILCIALLPAVAHAATPDVWDGSTASSLTGGGKSEDDPYLISTGAELKLLADNSRAAGLGSCYVKLTNDIVLNDGTFDKSGAFTKRGRTASQPNEWLPMGEASWHIDGDGHSISGMYIKCNEAKVGLISRITGGGYIRDLTIKDSYVTSSQAPGSYKGYIGVFAGQSSRTSFTNCAGENNIAVTNNCYLTGGIVGWSYGGDSFNVVHVSGSIQGSGALAGIAGRANGATFKNCWNKMNIDNANTDRPIRQSGGLAAMADSSEFYNCVNLGYLHGGSRIGGIAGEAPGKMKNCYTTSDISGIKEYGSRNYVATLAGMNSKNVAVQGCYAEDGSGLYDIGAEGEGSYVPHFTGKGNLGGGSDGELLAALNENLYNMDAEPNLNKWVLNSDGYPIPTGETFVDNTVYYDIWLDGVRVSERNEADILGDGLASYDKATSTLFLHDGLVVTSAYNQKLFYSESDINLCVDGDVKFQSSQNVGTGPCIIDLGSAGGSGNLKIYAPEGTSATVTVTGKYGEYGIDVSSLTLEGDVSLKVSADSAFAFCYTMTFTSPQAMLDAVSWGDNSAMRNPVQTINLPSSNAQKLYEDQGSGLVQVDAFTTSRKVEGYPYPIDRMYPHIRIAPVVSELIDSLPDSFTVSMTDANEESSLAAWVLGEIRKIEGITEDNSSVVVSDVRAATAGTFANQDGEAGSFTATVTLQTGGASMTKVIPGTIEPAAYAPPVITTSIKAGTVDADTGLFAEATDATFTCGDEVVFAVSYEADGSPVKNLQGSVSCYAEPKGLTWSEANGCYLTPTEPADCFTFAKAARYEVIFNFLATEEYAAQVGSIDIDVVKRPLEPQPSSARITIGDALPDIAVTYLDFVRDGKVYSAFADGDSADEVLENAYGYQLIDADGNVVSAEEACNKAGAYRIVPIAKLKMDENNWGSKYEIIGGAEGALEVFYPPAPHFTDVDYNSWYAPGVDFVAGRGLMKGYEGTTIFGVGSALTRGELATILWRNACPDEAASYDPATAKDATGIAGSADGMFYTAAANWAVENGVIKGIERPGGALDFAADEPVTFEQLATILGRLGAAPGELDAAGGDLSAFVDGADASGWSAPYLKWAADKGLVEGYDEPAGKRLAPGENAARERAATVLMRAFYLGVLK